MPFLLVVDTRLLHEVPPDGLTIGRDAGCGLVLDSPEVSRRHARVERDEAGFHVTDESTNGVFVNGERASHSHRLADGDVVRVGDVILRFGAGAAPAPGAPVPALPPRAAGSPQSRAETTLPTEPVRRRNRAELPPIVLATLAVLSGGAAPDTRFTIGRPVAQIGRGAASDIRLQDDTVSGAHATLMLRGSTWYLLDHSSSNGTYVNGAQIQQCALPGPCELRIGGVTLQFRPITP